MSDLSITDKIKFEKILEMNSGYVSDFSNRTFQSFILEITHNDIYDSKYSISGDSKANRLRTFWNIESNFTVGSLLLALINYWKMNRIANNVEISIQEERLMWECLEIAENLKRKTSIKNIDVIKDISKEEDFLTLSKLIHESIYQNEPRTSLDRLHTLLTKYIRLLCEKKSINVDKNKPIHSLFGEYIKYLKLNKLIESEMTERILKSSISIIEAFNEVRNNKSLAHDNQLLNNRESILIINNIINTIDYIESIESKKI
jgi:hypothetical protein